MKERIIGSFFVVLITLIILIPGNAVSAFILEVISLVGLFEFFRVFGLEKTRLSIVAYLGTMIYYVFMYLGKIQFVFPIVLAEFMLLLTIYVFAFPKYKDKDIFKIFFGFVYITVLFSYVYRVRSMKAGLLLSFFILISSWGNDVFAYLVGSAIGKHKFSPNVSPNKSVEGFVGGIIGAAVIGYAYAFLLKGRIPFNALYCALIAALGAIPAVIGDLAASAIKRDNGIKDYSHLIPGHGGIIDRVDSVIFTAPIIYYLVVLFNII